MATQNIFVAVTQRFMCITKNISPNKTKRGLSLLPNSNLFGSAVMGTVVS